MRYHLCAMFSHSDVLLATQDIPVNLAPGLVANRIFSPAFICRERARK